MGSNCFANCSQKANINGSILIGKAVTNDPTEIVLGAALFNIFSSEPNY